MSGTDGPAGRAGEPGAGAGPTADGARLAEEIRLLVDLVTERAEPWLRSVFAAGHGQGDPGSCEAQTPWGGASQPGSHESAAHPGSPAGSGADAAAEGDGDRASACSWCPLCAVIAIVRGETPEIAVRVLDQAAALIALLRAVLADRWQPDEGVHMPGYRPSSRPGPAPAGFTATPASVFAERPGRGSGGSGPAGSSRRVQRVPVRPRESWEPGE
ncbi:MULTISPECIES: hypothetical protein [Prauserella salsuginis group]|uniref:Uncharacterized protein n=2 Tax=Prauserella salsuginis group TaxID=2893672 RepID=A0A839XZ92_9PSEU|nr:MULTISPECIES: hypothetical protein [Prauserella salsuginis group]MBB3665035.1 hypothetical protein [Prauserella sediminis]MCR3718506.1 hypothetical protein [Prauserella flava]MCR3733076.1 hypothetical protein [Prauserella salsuginis]